MQDMRKLIIEALAGLKDIPFIHAIWLEGADARGAVDEFSDIDVWLDVDDGKEGQAFQTIQKELETIAPIDFEHEIEHQHPKIRQKFYHLEGGSEFLLVDVCLQQHSRVFWYTKGHDGEKVKILFDKSNVIQFRDRNVVQKHEIEERLKVLQKEFPLFRTWLKKELQRKHFLNAIEYYHRNVLEPLVETLRLRYEPSKAGYDLKYILEDLPKDVIAILEDLYKITSLKDIAKKSEIATELFQKTICDLQQRL